MRDFQIFDEFKDKLPKITFDKDLALPLHTKCPKNWNVRKCQSNEIQIFSLKLDFDFPDEDGLLETSYSDFRRFMGCYGIKESDTGYTLSLKKQDLGCFEAYSIDISADGIIVSANDTEGIRRALIYTEDEMKRRSGNFLPMEKIERRPFIKNRISRCYFTPASHAAIEELENELCDDIDYYPEEYLNRLMHDGTNALWLGASLRYLVKSDIIPEYGTDADKRMKKLNSVIEKCRRYGIKIFLFAVDPASSYCNPHLLNHPELTDDSNYGKWRLLCPSTDAGIAYLKDAVKTLFRNAPNLAGYINLTLGESLSTCASNGGVLRCKRCKAKFGTIGKTLAFVEKTISDAMHEVNPTAEYISWTYEQRNWKHEDLAESCKMRDESVIHLQNFEDFGRPIQLGKKRIAYDYWLSYPGPGKLFEDTVKENEALGKKTYAKIQVCSSHEISTVPYVTAPGILYDKYSYFFNHGIEGVMQCWFFGNYPCLMNKAAGELAFLPFPKTKDEFLGHLAGIYWGEDAKDAARAWSLFEKGYRNFPVSVSFEWLGPMQDSPVAPLHLKPIDRSMPSTWLATDAMGGDRLGECMCNGHTHEEVMELVQRMDESWREGNDILNKLENFENEDRIEQKSVALATALIFRSGYNIIRFYYLRRLLGIEKGDPCEIFQAMRAIAEEEIAISESLIPICEQDNRIGYHSEAHGHKIFPEKLKWRIKQLKELLATEFIEVEKRITAGLSPLPFYNGEEGNTVVYKIGEDKELYLKNQSGENGETYIEISEVDNGYNLLITAKNFSSDCIVIKPEFRMFHPSVPIYISKGEFIFPTSKISFFTFANSYRTFSIHPDDIESEIEKYKFKTEELESGGYRFTLFIDRDRFGMEATEQFRLDIKRLAKDQSFDSACTDAKEALCFSERTVTRLIHGTYSPECYAFILPKKRA